MTGRHKSIRRTVAVALQRSVLWGLTVGFLPGCTASMSSGGAVDSNPAVPSGKSERELLLDIERKFENPQAHYELARFYHNAREWTKAEYQYNIALGFQPSLLPAQAGLIKLYVDENEPAKAAQYANSYMRQSVHNVRDTLQLAWEFENIGLNEYALRCFRQALNEAPDSYDANKQMGLYYLSKGDTDKARQYLGRSFELNPNQPDVAGALGRLGVVVQSPQPEPQAAKKAQN
jgi:tetratricopeptide (TPR) repeat protein